MSRPHRQPRRVATASPHTQRGVAAVFFGIAIVALVTMVMLGFNIGQLYYAQRDLERQSALAALAGAQVASGCRAGVGGIPGTTGVPGSLAAVNAAVANSLAVNASGSDGASLTPTVELGMIDSTRAATNGSWHSRRPIPQSTPSASA